MATQNHTRISTILTDVTALEMNGQEHLLYDGAV